MASEPAVCLLSFHRRLLLDVFVADFVLKCAFKVTVNICLSEGNMNRFRFDWQSGAIVCITPLAEYSKNPEATASSAGVMLPEFQVRSSLYGLDQ